MNYIKNSFKEYAEVMDVEQLHREEIMKETKCLDKIIANITLALDTVHSDMQKKNIALVCRNVKEELSNAKAVYDQIRIKVPRLQYYKFSYLFRIQTQNLVHAAAMMKYLENGRLISLCSVASALGMKSADFSYSSESLNYVNNGVKRDMGLECGKSKIPSTPADCDVSNVATHGGSPDTNTPVSLWTRTAVKSPRSESSLGGRMEPVAEEKDLTRPPSPLPDHSLKEDDSKTSTSMSGSHSLEKDAKTPSTDPVAAGDDKPTTQSLPRTPRKKQHLLQSTDAGVDITLTRPSPKKPEADSIKENESPPPAAEGSDTAPAVPAEAGASPGIDRSLGSPKTQGSDKRLSPISTDLNASVDNSTGGEVGESLCGEAVEDLPDDKESGSLPAVAIISSTNTDGTKLVMTAGVPAPTFDDFVAKEGSSSGTPADAVPSGQDADTLPEGDISTDLSEPEAVPGPSGERAQSPAEDLPGTSGRRTLSPAESDDIPLNLPDCHSPFSVVSDDQLLLETEDYLHGVLQMASDLARLAVNTVVMRDYKLPITINNFLRDLHAGYALLVLKNNHLRKAFDELKYSLRKTEDVVYNVSLRLNFQSLAVKEEPTV